MKLKNLTKKLNSRNVFGSKCIQKKLTLSQNPVVPIVCNIIYIYIYAVMCINIDINSSELSQN